MEIAGSSLQNRSGRTATGLRRRSGRSRTGGSALGAKAVVEPKSRTGGEPGREDFAKDQAGNVDPGMAETERFWSLRASERPIRAGGSGSGIQKPGWRRETSKGLFDLARDRNLRTVKQTLERRGRRLLHGSRRQRSAREVGASAPHHLRWHTSGRKKLRRGTAVPGP